ncbi:MAG: histidine kinase [Saprospiraceae bacterium]|nr:histidine kinase [Saprospiraceae bacterium]
MTGVLYRLSWRDRFRLAFGLTAIFYVVLLFVNLLPERWDAGLWAFLPVFLFEYVAGSLHVVLFIRLAEWIQEQLMIRFGVSALGMDRPFLNLIFILFFLAAGALVSGPGVFLVSFMAKSLAFTNPLPHISQEYHFHGLRAAIALFAILALFVYLIILNRHILHRTQAIQDRAEQLEKEQILAQFNTLKNQVSPHFLFNNLSILTSLIQVNPELSEQFIQQLSKTYRYILEQKDQVLIALRTELDFIDAYAFLLKIRFGEKFDLKIQVPDHIIERGQIAPLTLQLLVENALKHNRMSAANPLLVEIFVEDDFLVVRNKLQPRPVPEASTGIGLKNIIHRYALLARQSVWAGETASFFVVKVPILYKSPTFDLEPAVQHGRTTPTLT